MSRRARRPLPGALALAGLLGLAAVLAAGCGGNEGSLAQDHSATRPSFRINFDEEEFAADPELHANPDDIVTVRLEDPAGAYTNSLDTGAEPGVDVIPYRYFETMEREYCWEIDPGAEPPSGGAASYMRLLDDAGDVVLRVEQDGECVRETIPAGTYTAEFHHGASANGDRDVLFIMPRESAENRAQSAAVADDTNAAVAAPDPGATPAPYCPNNRLPGDEAVGGVMVLARIINDAYGQPCPAPPKKWGYLPFEFFSAPGTCTDVSLIQGKCTYVGPVFFAGTPAGYNIRLYEDLFFRGGRKTVTATVDLPAEYAAYIGDFVVFNGPASMLLVTGAPAANADTLIRTNGCEGCNLSGVSLDGRDLDRAWLKLADLSHASLSGTHLNKIWGEDTIFKSAHLVGAQFNEAFLGKAHFDSAGRVDETSGQVYPAADLTGAKMGSAVLGSTDLRGAKLDRADLSKAKFDGADLSGASAVSAVFQSAEMTATANLSKGTLNGADFTDAVMNGVAMTGAVGTDIILTRAKLSGANLQGAVFNRARMEGADLSKAVLGRNLEQTVAACQLSGAYMANVNLSSAEATGINLRQARFYGRTASAVSATMVNADFGGAELSGTDFTGAALSNASFDGATCVNCKFTRARMAATSVATMDGARFSGARLQGADFSQATASGCIFTDATLSFGSGTYSVGGGTEFQYTSVYAATQVGEVATLSNVICPDGGPGPCNTEQRLSPHGSTPTRIPTRTPPPTWTPGGDDPFATPTPR